MGLGRPLALLSLALVILDALLVVWWTIATLLSSRDYETTVGLKYAASAFGVVACASGLLFLAARTSSLALAAGSLAVAMAPVGYVYLGRPLYQMREVSRYLNTPNQFGDPRLQTLAAAIDAGDPAAVRAAAREGADWNALLQGNITDTTILGYAVAAVAEKGSPVPLVEALLDAGADPNTALLYGEPLLRGTMLFAGKPNTLAVAKLLLERGANPNPPGDSAAPLPQAGSDPELVKLLLKHGANVNSEDHGYTAAYRFASSRRWDAAILLVEAGADIDYREPDGNTLENQAVISLGSDPQAQKLLDAIRARRARRQGK